MSESTQQRLARRVHFLDCWICVLEFSAAMFLCGTEHGDGAGWGWSDILTAEIISDLHATLTKFELRCPIARPASWMERWIESEEEV